MKELYQQAQAIATEAQIIADNLNDYNPGIHKKKVPLEILQTDAGNLTKEFAALYGK